MQKIIKNFSQEIQDSVAAEKLIRVPKFPVKDCYFVTPEMERIYVERTGQAMPGICVVCKQFPAIMVCDGPRLKGIKEGIEVYLLWEAKHPQSKEFVGTYAGAV